MEKMKTNNEQQSTRYVPFSCYFPQPGCGCRDWREDFKTDCWCYMEDKDMGATTPWCSNKHAIIEQSDCDGCKDYIPKKEVYKITSEILDWRRHNDG